MTRFLVCSLVVLALAAADRQSEERLSFQTGGPWSPRVNLDADVAMVYGIGPTLPEKIETWRNKGYRIHVMTGVAWGNYQDYLNGKWDGRDHWDEAQTDRNGKRVMHGRSTDIPYMSPGENYGRYLCVGVKRALDAGAEAIHLEEPEFWAKSGYEESFKREWKAYYHEDWLPPHSSPDAQYRASKLKYHLYRRALQQVFQFAQDYGREHNRKIRCYVPTHSLINYAHWRIVSPESSLLDVGADGYIAQVWTGTARTPNVYEGRREQRTFETAFCEYGAMQNLARASGRRIWYLNDPIEDNPNHSWKDYRENWENTLTASLLQPEVWHYEIMPWPDRIFTRNYPAREPSKPGEVVERIPIPKEYETELQAVIRALGEMKQPLDRVRWEVSGTRGIGVLVSDTMMFQRADPEPSDQNLGSFYGLAMPLIKRGMPVEPVQIESAASPAFLKNYRVLLLTYEGQKPPKPEFHAVLNQWVRNGGALVVVDDDGDPYNRVREWWNSGANAFATPRQHLFQTLGLKPDATGLQRVGMGVVLRTAMSPAALTYKPDGAGTVRGLVRQASDAIHLPWKEANALVLRRGPYVVAAGLSDPAPGSQPATVRGRFVDLFATGLPVRTTLTLAPEKRALLFDLDAVKSETPKVVAAACRIREESYAGGVLRLRAEGIANTNAAVRILSPRAPKTVRVAGAEAAFRLENGTLLLHFANSPDGVTVELQY